MPLPQIGRQSASVFASSPGGQQSSLSKLASAGRCVQTAVQLALEPLSSSVVQATLSSQLLGHGTLLFGSHVSSLLTTPSPQLGLQSLSELESASGGQQPSPFAALVIGVCVHVAVHSAAAPSSLSFVQGSLSSQLVGQGVLLLGSHFSPSLSVPSPQLALQSLSMLGFALGGQQPSPSVVVVIGVCVHVAVHCAAFPSILSAVHALPSSQLVGHGVLLLGSHFSPASSTPLPHALGQSLSVVFEQPDGQQPSPLLQSVISVTLH